MKAIFSILGLLIVVAITGFMAKKQFGSVSETTAKPQDGSQILVPATTPGAPPQEQSQQIQHQVKQSVEAAMQQVRPIPDEK